MLLQDDGELTYVKDNYEVDFLTAATLYQVSYNIDDEKTRKRELQAFSYFKTAQIKNCRLITYETTAAMDEVEVLSVDDFIFTR